MSQQKTPQEAARLAEKRAKQAEAQHKPDTGPPGFTSEEILTALQENEEGDARLLVTAMKDKFAFDVKRQTFYRFKGGYWRKDLGREVLAFAGRVLRENYGKETARQYGIITDPQADEERKAIAEKNHKKLRKRIDTVNTLRRRESVLKLASSGDNSLAVSGDEWNADPWTIQFDDQILDLKTGQARPGLPSDYITKAAPTKWKGIGEPAVSWVMFLREIFNEDVELVAYMQRVLGCALVGVPSPQEFYIFYGQSGRNGKSTIMETLKAILGEGLAAPIRSELIMENRHGNGGGADPELLELQGRRITWTSETGDNKWLNAEKIKLFTGGDTISGRLMYANEIISFPPTHTLIMLTNHRPRIKGDDAAIWSRLRNIPFLLSFVDNPQQRHERQKDPDLRESLEKEASGILAWLVQGCLNWQKEGLNPPAIVIDAGLEYRLSEYPLQQFINERCETGEGLKIQAGPLYDAFVEWFEETRGAKSSPPSRIKMSDQLQKIPGIVREAGSRVVYFHGITLLDPGT